MPVTDTLAVSFSTLKRIAERASEDAAEASQTSKPLPARLRPSNTVERLPLIGLVVLHALDYLRVGRRQRAFASAKMRKQTLARKTGDG